MTYQRKDMYYNDYTWTTKYNGDDPRVTGVPDSTLLARKEGWEMLYFINACAKEWKWTNDASFVNACKKLEKLIRLHVPANIRSQKNIFDWIEANWKKFWDNL